MFGCAMGKCPTELFSELIGNENESDIWRCLQLVGKVVNEIDCCDKYC